MRPFGTAQIVGLYEYLEVAQILFDGALNEQGTHAKAEGRLITTDTNRQPEL